MSDLSRIDELTFRLLDELITDEEQRQLEQLVHASPQAAERHFALLEQEALLRGSRRDFDLSGATLDRIRSGQGARLEQRVMTEIKKKRKEGAAMTYSPIEPSWSWLWGKRFWKFAAGAAVLLILVLGTDTWRVVSRRAQPQEAFLYGQEELTPGIPSAHRVFVRNAVSARPIEGARVQLAVYDSQGRSVWSVEAKTDADGIVQVEPELDPSLPEGTYALKLEASSGQGTSTVEKKLTLKRSFRVMVTTDKPLYQPGQTIHIRSLSLASRDLKPVKSKPVTIEVQDAKGNKVFKKSLETSGFGIASADFVLADQVNQGEYKVSAMVGDTSSERSVAVKRYRLPTYRVDLVPDRGFYQPGERVQGVLTAGYTFGKPVAGAEVKITASEFIDKFIPFATVHGRTDSEGRMLFSLPLKDAFAGSDLKKGDASVFLEAEVKDTAGHIQKKSLDLVVTTRPIRIELFPESGTLVQNVENVLYILTAYPDGRPAQTRITVGATGESLETSEVGIAKVKITPKSNQLKLTVTAEDNKGVRSTVTRQLRINERTGPFLLRTDRAVYRAGETADLEIVSPVSKGVVFLDVVKDRRTVLTRSIQVRDGRGELALDLPPDLFGTLEIHAYRILPDGNMISDARVIQVNRAAGLTVSAELDRDTYRPAEKALLKLAVQRADGSPVQAALGLAGVDEAVFALHEMRPGLERVYFMLQEEILKPRYEIHAHLPFQANQAVESGRPETPELEEASVVLFSAAEGKTPPAKKVSETFSEKNSRYRQAERKHYSRLAGAASLIPSILFLLLTLPWIGYALRRLFVRTPIEAEFDDVTVRQLRRATWRIGIWWALTFYLPVASLLVSGLLLRRHYGMEVGVSLAFITGFFALGMLVLWVARFRWNPASAALPLARKLLVGLPVAAPLAFIGFFALEFANDTHPQALGDELAAVFGIASLAAAFLTAGSLMAGLLGALRRISTAGWFGIVGSWTAVLFLPIAFSTVFFLGGMAKAPMANALAGDEFEARAQMKDTDIESPGAKKGPAGLQAPTRVRRHFPETLLWKPELITDSSGQASLEIPLADSITTWRIAMSAVSAQGELGSAEKGLRVFQDFFVDIDFPVALTQHDKVSVPVAVYNYLESPQTIRLEVEPRPWFRLAGGTSRTLRVKPGQVTSVSLDIEALQPGTHGLTVRAHGSKMADAIERTVRVEPDGKAFVTTLSGQLDENKVKEFVIPEKAIQGANDLFVKIYPGSFSQVVEGLDSIFRMPSGCFEQTSSATYPNVLVLDYLRQTKQIKPELEMKALNFINIGYQRLLSYEVSGGGFEWFGKSPAHTVLTAYGLMEFTDMAKVYEVDPAVISRTREWLFDQQKDDGSWEPPQGGIAEGAINQYQGQVLRTTAYVAWAMAESAPEGNQDTRLEAALLYIAENVGKEKDPYTLAVCANALVAGGHKKAAGRALAQLDALKIVEDKLVHWSSKSEGVTHSRGNVLDIETTALAAYAYLKAKREVTTAHKALAWLVTQKDAFGNWHSTQATIHTFRALLLGAGPGGEVEGRLQVTVTANGKVAKELTITPDTADVFHLVSLREMVKPGKNLVALETAGKGNLAYQIVAAHYLPWPKEERVAEKPMTIDLQYDHTTLKKNDRLGCRVTVNYKLEGVARMTIVDLGIPPGFEALPGTFDALRDNGVIERYSVTGRQVILYIREIAGGKPLSFLYQLRAKYPVKVSSPPAGAYQYYQPEIRDKTRPVKLTVL